MTPNVKSLKLAINVPTEALQVAIRFLYMGDLNLESLMLATTLATEEDILKGIDKISKQLEIESLWQEILVGTNRRLARQKRQEEIARGREQMDYWYRENVLKHKIEVSSDLVMDVKWSQENNIFADILLRADEPTVEEVKCHERQEPAQGDAADDAVGSSSIPIGSFKQADCPSTEQSPEKSILFPAHRAMLVRSDYFQTMFASPFREAATSTHLHIVTVDCSPAVLELVLDYLYTEKADIPLHLAVDVIFAADMLMIDKLKTKAAVVLSTLGNGSVSLADRTHTGIGEEEGPAEGELINIYDVLRAAWITRVQRLETFSARYIAYRLEDYIDDPDFEILVKESAERIQTRQDTDTIELIDE